VREEKICRNYFRVITVEFVFASYLIVNEIFSFSLKFFLNFLLKTFFFKKTDISLKIEL